MKHLKEYKDYSNQLKCKDCGGKTEAYFVKDTIWYNNVPKSKQSGSLCLECLEKRVGRELKQDDFKSDKLGAFTFKQPWWKHIKEDYKDWSNWEKDYSHIKVDNRFLRDLDYTFEIFKQMNPTLKTNVGHEHELYQAMLKGEELDDGDLYEAENYEEMVKERIREYMSVFKQDKIEVTRIISIDRMDDFNMDRLGKYWSFCEYPSYDFHTGEHKIYVKIEATINHDSVNWMNSFYNYVFYGDEECEVQAKEGSDVFVKQVHFRELYSHPYYVTKDGVRKTKWSYRFHKDQKIITKTYNKIGKA